MRFQRARDEPEIPTASMADIAFLLIVFFMVTTVFAETRGINFQVPPPKPPDEQEATDKEEAVHIKIDPTGVVYLDGKVVERATLAKDMSGYLMPKLERWPEKPILVTYDKQSPYGIFIEVYDSLRRIEDAAKEAGYVPPRNGLKVSIPSLKEIEALKAQFGEDIFG